jgi:hypothetical protein
MIDFKICKTCKDSKFQPPEQDKEGNLTVCPSILCELTMDLLLMNSNPPFECPNGLMHKLSTQVIPNNFANYMSGIGSLDEADF